MAVFTYVIDKPIKAVTAAPVPIIYAVGPQGANGSLASHAAGGVYATLDVQLKGSAVRVRVCMCICLRARVGVRVHMCTRACVCVRASVCK